MRKILIKNIQLHKAAVHRTPTLNQCGPRTVQQAAPDYIYVALYYIYVAPDYIYVALYYIYVALIYIHVTKHAACSNYWDFLV